MTLAETAAANDVPLEALRERLGLPEDVNRDERLDRLGPRYGFNISEERTMSRHKDFRLIAIVVVVVAISIAGFVMERAIAASAATQPASKAALLFNLTGGTSGSGVHAVSMGLGLASSAAKEGHDVVVFLNVDATQFASRNLSENVKVADFPPVKQLVASVIANGGKVFVCKHCAAVARVDTKSLVDGAVLANHEDILAQIRLGTVGFSY